MTGWCSCVFCDCCQFRACSCQKSWSVINGSNGDGGSRGRRIGVAVVHNPRDGAVCGIGVFRVVVVGNRFECRLVVREAVGAVKCQDTCGFIPGTCDCGGIGESEDIFCGLETGGDSDGGRFDVGVIDIGDGEGGVDDFGAIPFREGESG
ncbi:hypothetical protein MITS9509_01287 [Synechococcus sp. MIT S9509]|nr:hypothetical protein MITS9509_01287 [Synechococcus sp. MIT S9509]